MSALVGRVGLHVPRPDPGFIQSELTPLARILGQAMRSSPCRLEEVYRRYSGLKRARYERAHAQIVRQGGAIYRDQAKIKMFVKMEGYKIKENKPFPDCRAIQFRSFEYTLMLASKIRPAEHKMYLLKDVPGFPQGRMFAKNMNQFEKAQAIVEMVTSMPGARMVCCDLSRYDAHLQIPILRDVEHVAWNTAVGDPELARLLRMQLRNIGSAHTSDGKIRYRVNGERMSGDANTAGGNCIITACALTGFFKTRGYEFRILVDGDDSVAVYRGPELTLDELDGYFRRLGMVIGIDCRPTCIEEVDFCQSRPVQVDGVWTMIRDPMKVLTKVGLTHRKDSVAAYKKRLLTIATCEGFLARGVPILQAYSRALIRNCVSQMSARQLKRGFMKGEVLSYRMQHLVGTPTEYDDIEVSDSTRRSFERAFGIPPEEQRVYEKYLGNWSFDLSSHQPAGGMTASWYLAGPYPEFVQLGQQE